jgi:hypothetical protein
VNRRGTNNAINKIKQKDKETNIGLHHTSQKIKDLAIQTPLNTGGERRCSGWMSCYSDPPFKTQRKKYLSENFYMYVFLIYMENI